MNVLILNNHPAQANFLENSLKAENYIVEKVNTEEHTLLRLCHKVFHIVVIKHDPPIINAIETCGKIKRITASPIVVITNEQHEMTYMLLKEAGAELVFSQPFSFTTLCKHMKILTETYEIKSKRYLKVHDLTLDTTVRVAKRKKQAVFLRNKEFSLLEYLMNHPNQVLSRNQIIESVWNQSSNGFTNTVDVHINRLRKKIDNPFRKKLIHTIPCIGYMLSENQPYMWN